MFESISHLNSFHSRFLTRSNFSVIMKFIKASHLSMDCSKESIALKFFETVSINVRISVVDSLFIGSKTIILMWLWSNYRLLLYLSQRAFQATSKFLAVNFKERII